LLIFIERECLLYLIEKTQHTRPAFYRFVELKVKMRGIFDDDTAGKFALKMLSLFLEGFKRLLFLPRGSDRADEDMGVLQIRGYVNGANGDEGGLKLDVTSYNHTKFPLDKFADSKKPEFHNDGSFRGVLKRYLKLRLQGLGDLFERVTLDNVTYLVFREIS
jgi:hypothetical protein